MPYVDVALTRFYDTLYVAKSTEKVTYYCRPACFEWIKSLGKEGQTEAIHWMEIMLPFESLATRPIKETYQPRVQINHLHNFPLKESDTPHLVSIFNFFEALQKQRGNTVTEQMEFAVVSGSYPHVPKDVMERLVAFCFKHVIPKHERLRVAFSTRIRPFLNGDSMR